MSLSETERKARDAVVAVLGAHQYYGPHAIADHIMPTIGPMLATPEMLEAVEACKAYHRAFPLFANPRGAGAGGDVARAGRALLALEKKPERYTVSAYDNDLRRWRVTDEKTVGAECIAKFKHEADARAYAAQKNAEDAARREGGR